MRVIVLTTILLFSVNLIANDHLKVVTSHLKAHGYGKSEPIQEQETESSILYLEEFAIEDEDHPCHIGVVVSKTSGEVVPADSDNEISLYFPYSDVFILRDSMLVKVCAD